MIASLVRTGSTPWGTFGVLYLPDAAPIRTVENQWIDNAPNVSCIPDGLYPVQWNKDTERWHVERVPGRTAIQFHAGNTHADTQGCILPGLRPHVFENGPGVSSSRDALALVESVFRRGSLDEKGLFLSVRWADHSWHHRKE